jgi:predicted nucleotidyltransferase
MIEIEPDVEMSVYDYVGLKRYIAGLLDGPVDVIDREGLKPYIRPPVEGEAVYAF